MAMPATQRDEGSSADDWKVQADDAEASVDLPGPDGMAALPEMAAPFREDNLESRSGYDPDFLGIAVPLPLVVETVPLALPEGSHDPVLRYEHFSLVMHGRRRLALYTAANVDGRPQAREPEPGRDYTRRGLSGLKEGASETWFTDPRLAGDAQLSDRFFTRDGGAFDKGHLVRRDDVTWGATYEEVRRANGDSYHITNCSPQVKAFNQSSFDGLWGQLEQMVTRQVGTERATLFAGPVLDPADKFFRGRGESGDLLVQIPSRYWKVIVVRQDDRPAAYAFLLEQDLGDVTLEFAVEEPWRRCQVTLNALQAILKDLQFAEILHQGDQAQTAQGELLRAAYSLELMG
jgi:endonuclease G